MLFIKIIVIIIFVVWFFLRPLVHLDKLQTKEYTTQQHEYALLNLRDKYENYFASMNYLWAYVRSQEIDFAIFPFLVNDKTILYLYGLNNKKRFHYEIEINTQNDITYKKTDDWLEMNFKNYYIYRINFKRNLIYMTVNTNEIKSDIVLTVNSYKSVYPKDLGRFWLATATSTFDSYTPTLLDVQSFTFNGKNYENTKNTIAYLELALSKEVFWPYIWLYMETQEWTIIFIWHGPDRCAIVRNRMEGDEDFIYMGQIAGKYKFAHKPYSLSIDVKHFIDDFNVLLKSKKINISMKTTGEHYLVGKMLLHNWQKYLEDHIVNCDVSIEYKNKTYDFNENVYLDIYDAEKIDLCKFKEE